MLSNGSNKIEINHKDKNNKYKNIHGLYSGEISKIKNYIEKNYLLSNSITDLHKKRASQFLAALDNSVESLSNSDPDDFKKMILKRIKDSLDLINQYLTEPFSLFPDVNIWLISDNNNKEPIGVCTIHSSDILWSKDDKEKGCICNKHIYTDIKVMFYFLF